MSNIDLKQFSLTIRIKYPHEGTYLGDMVRVIECYGGEIAVIEHVATTVKYTTKDIVFKAGDSTARTLIEKNALQLTGGTVMKMIDEVMKLHVGGKLVTGLKNPIRSMEDLSKVYTPGVAKVCQAIAADQDKAYEYTIKKNTVAVISDGTAVLGLGDIGPKAAMPVMEGKAALFKQFADVDAFPICLDTKDTEEIIAIVKALAPAFGGINLEDISSPRCFEIEARLKQELDIPVFHDDQHGTAIVVLAGILNALKVCRKSLKDVKIVVNGIGSAGIAVSKMLLHAGAVNLIGVDRQGAINRITAYDKPHWSEFALITNPFLESGSLSEVIKAADVFIGLSAPNALKLSDVKSMAADPIIFAMANPTPEIDPEIAAPYVKVMATGRSDFPNQINNVLCFPGIFRGALDCGATEINEDMKLAAAEAISSVIDAGELNEHYIMPNAFDSRVVERIREAVIRAAVQSGVARQSAYIETK